MRDDPDTLYLHPRRGRAALFAVVAALAAAGLAWFAWILADPDWGAGGARRAAFLESVPVVARVGIFGAIALVCGWGTWRLAAIALRREPMFAIGPDGVADLRRDAPRLLAWGDVARVSIDNNHLIFHPAKGAAVAASLFGPKGRIAIPLNLVATPREEVVRRVVQQAPHLAR